MSFARILFFTSLLLGPVSGHAQKINGVEGLGVLKVDQVVFPGSHNAGAGFDGVLRTSTGRPVASAWYRNQTLSFEDQLKQGIRYFDIDTMWVPKDWRRDMWKPGGAWTGHSGAYGGPVDTIFKQVKAFMDANPNEVVVLHFNNNIQREEHTDDDTTLIAEDISQLMSTYFPDSGSGVKLGQKGSDWPTLADAVSDNERLFIFVHADIYNGSGDGSFLQNHSYWENGDRITNAYNSDGISSAAGVSKVLIKNAGECDTDTEFVRLSLMTTKGMAIGDMAGWANNYYAKAVEAAARMRAGHGKVANFLLVDRVESGNLGDGDNNLITIANRLNIMKIAEVRIEAIRQMASQQSVLNPPPPPPPIPGPPPPSKSTYKLVFQTGDKSKAGTNSNIKVVINGPSGSTKPRTVNPLIRGNAFEKGDKDTASYVDRYIGGKATSIKITHDGKGIGSGWYLKSVTVTVDGKSKSFTANKWIDDETVTLR